MSRTVPGDAYAADAMLRYMEEHFGGFKQVVRRNLLLTHAERLAKQASDGVITDCEGFSQVLAYAVSQFPDANDLGVEAMMEDLKSVLIGSGLENSQRNTGLYALKYQSFMDTGFKTEFREFGNQVQHAMAGLYISYTYGWVGTIPAMLIEDSDADKALYRVTFRLGSALDFTNYTLLPTQVKAELAA